MQLHNTTVALSALQAAGVQLQAMPTSSGLVSLKPEDVIDGDRERTLSLLWAVARTLQLGVVLKVSALKAEVHRVLARTRVSGRRPLLPLLASSGSGSGRGAAAQQVPLAVYMHDELLSALQEWVQAVCAAYDVSVQNFTTCFGDGVDLCLLVSCVTSSSAKSQAVGQISQACRLGLGLTGPAAALQVLVYWHTPASGLFCVDSHARHAIFRPFACAQVHYYLPNAIDLADVFISKQRRQEAAKQAGSQQQQPDDAQLQQQQDSEASLHFESSVCTSAAGVRDMLLTSNAAAAAANAAAAAEAAAADGSCGNMHWAKGGLAMEFDLSGCGVPETEDEAMVTSRGVAANFRAVHRAAKALGGVPEMLSAKDFAEHGPDERAVILYVAFLCTRLLECSKDDRAAHIIQTAWRQAKSKSAGAESATLHAAQHAPTHRTSSFCLV